MTDSVTHTHTHPPRPRATNRRPSTYSEFDRGFLERRRVCGCVFGLGRMSAWMSPRNGPGTSVSTTPLFCTLLRLCVVVHVLSREGRGTEGRDGRGGGKGTGPDTLFHHTAVSTAPDLSFVRCRSLGRVGRGSVGASEDGESKAKSRPEKDTAGLVGGRGTGRSPGLPDPGGGNRPGSRGHAAAIRMQRPWNWSRQPAQGGGGAGPAGPSLSAPGDPPTLAALSGSRIFFWVGAGWDWVGSTPQGGGLVGVP